MNLWNIFPNTVPGGKTVWEGIVLITGSKGLGWYIASTGLIVLYDKETHYFLIKCSSSADPPKCKKLPTFLTSKSWG